MPIHWLVDKVRLCVSFNRQYHTKLQLLNSDHPFEVPTDWAARVWPLGLQANFQKATSF